MMSVELYVFNPFLNNTKYVVHSSLPHDNWPILAGNIIVKDGKVFYLDEESGRFKPRNKLYLFEQILGKEVFSEQPILKVCNLPDTSEAERCSLEQVNDLFDLYKHFFYTNL